MSLIYLETGGCLFDRVEGKLTFKYLMFNDEHRVSVDDPNETASGNLFSAQLQAKYRICEKFAAGCRFAFTSDNNEGLFLQGNSGMDLGLVLEYNPTLFTYIRLEGGMLSFSNSDHEDRAKVFFNSDQEAVSSRMGVSISMG